MPFNPSTCEAEPGKTLWVRGQPALWSFRSSRDTYRNSSLEGGKTEEKKEEWERTLLACPQILSSCFSANRFLRTFEILLGDQPVGRRCQTLLKCPRVAVFPAELTLQEALGSSGYPFPTIFPHLPCHDMLVQTLSSKHSACSVAPAPLPSNTSNNLQNWVLSLSTVNDLMDYALCYGALTDMDLPE